MPAFSENIKEKIDQAFKNVELALTSVGGKGWSQVYRIRSWHADLNQEVTAAMVENIKKYIPDHRPVWTQLGTRLAMPGMNIEIEVVAYDTPGAE
jgi:non-canonical poly(A) RNA polymerase PAPD5/7